MSQPRSQNFFSGPVKLRVKLARAAGTTNLIALFAAGVFYALGYSVEHAGSAFNQYAFILHAIVLVSGATLLTTGVYRIVGGGASDEFEIAISYKAVAVSFVSLGVFLLLFVFALQTWAFGLKEVSPVQITDTLGAMIWGVMDIILVLPAAILSWLLPTDPIEDE